jgi:hypothetical protein
MTVKPKRPKIQKRTPGLVINPPAPRPASVGVDPSAQLFKAAKEAEVQAQRQEAALPAAPVEPPTTHHPPPTIDQPPPTTQTIAPARDFARVANSITRDAVPAGLFRGESKKLYDALYLRTRGAVVPRRSLRATHDELMDWARVSHNTLKAHLKHLTKVGLLKVHYVRGDNTGAEYEVLIPGEEVTPPTTHHPPSTTQQILAPPTTQILVLGGGGQVAEESTAYENPKTSFKTNTENTDDDEALADFTSALKRAVKEITGREVSAAERQRWMELAELLVTELKIAAGRTTVSNVPAFFTEHLRRRLWKKEKRQLEADAAQASTAEKASPEVDATQCTDCYGTGMWYPQGYDKGVARCHHEKLSTPEEK